MKTTATFAPMGRTGTLPAIPCRIFTEKIGDQDVTFALHRAGGLDANEWVVSHVDSGRSFGWPEAFHKGCPVSNWRLGPVQAMKAARLLVQAKVDKMGAERLLSILKAATRK